MPIRQKTSLVSKTSGGIDCGSQSLGAFAELAARRQISVHLFRRKDIRTRRADHVLEPVQHACLKNDAAVRCSIGEQPGDEVLRRIVLLDRHLLHHAARDQSTHRVRHQHDALVVGLNLALDQLDQVIQARRGRLDVESVGGEVPSDVGEDPLEERATGRRGERCGGLVIKPVHPNRIRVDGAILAVLQIGVLVPLHKQPILVVDHQPQHRALELIEGRLTGSTHPHMGGTLVEPVKRIVDLRVDPGGRTRIPADIDNRQTHHKPSLPGIADSTFDPQCGGSRID